MKKVTIESKVTEISSRMHHLPQGRVDEIRRMAEEGALPIYQIQVTKEPLSNVDVIDLIEEIISNTHPIIRNTFIEKYQKPDSFYRSDYFVMSVTGGYLIKDDVTYRLSPGISRENFIHISSLDIETTSMLQYANDTQLELLGWVPVRDKVEFLTMNLSGYSTGCDMENKKIIIYPHGPAETIPEKVIKEYEDHTHRYTPDFEVVVVAGPYELAHSANELIQEVMQARRSEH